jgi:hypothetical protein
VGVLLHSSLDLPGFVRLALSRLDPADLARHASISVAVGFVVWLLLALIRSQTTLVPFRDALAETAPSLDVLLLRPLLTVLALVSLALQPTYPYAFTLPVALGQDLSIAVDAAILAALLATHLPRPAFPLRRAVDRVRRVPRLRAAHSGVRAALGRPPGNEPKTLRMAVALGHGLSLDVEGVSAGWKRWRRGPCSRPRETRPRPRARVRAHDRGPRARPARGGRVRHPRHPRHPPDHPRQGRRRLPRARAGHLAAARARPALDRASTRAGTPGRLAVTVAFWNALAAALVAAVFLLARDGGSGAGNGGRHRRADRAAAAACFYSYQFYPGDAGSASSWPSPARHPPAPPASARGAFALGLLLAFLPWLHQKFLPVWALLALVAVVRLVDALVTTRELVAFVAPQVVSLYLTALYNFAVTGSVRPDALYLAWGPGGVNSSRWGQGLFGLTLDARYGSCPTCPSTCSRWAASSCPARPARVLRRGAAAMFVYYLTVAAADNWSGAVCNLGRYIMPVLPYAAALIALTVVAVGGKRGVYAVGLAFSAWSALLAGGSLERPARRQRLRAAPGPQRDRGRERLHPESLHPHVGGGRARPVGAPRGVDGSGAVSRSGCGAREGSRRRTRDGCGLRSRRDRARGQRPVLERWPTVRTSARFPDAVEAGPGATAFVEGAHVDGERAWVDPGAHEILVAPATAVARCACGPKARASCAWPARRPWPFPPGPGDGLRSSPSRELQGRRGATETLWRQRWRSRPRTWSRCGCARLDAAVR